MMELNSEVLTGQLTTAMQSFESYVQFLNNAYAVPGMPYLFPLIVLAIIAIAVYNKTQNIAVTVAVISLTYVMISQIIGGKIAMFMTPITGLLVLASAYILWRLFTGGV